MAKFLATRIIGGFLEYNNVPATLKEQTKEDLIKLGREDLAEEGGKSNGM